MTETMHAFDDVIGRMNGEFDNSRPVFGIDLGTTNSAISVITTGNHVEPITLNNGKQTMPSCVMWKDGKFIVGQEAYEHRYLPNVIYSVKRLMQDVNAEVTFKDGDKELKMTPAQVSAEILKGLVEKTDGVYGEVKDVVVTVPAYFNQNGRNHTREACEIAGLNLIDIINEPTAASLCYDIDVRQKESEDVLIFDLGGGTFDVTLARIVDNNTSSELEDIFEIEDDKPEGRIVSCLSIGGNAKLGGDDIDEKMFAILCRELEGKGVKTKLFTEQFRKETILKLEQLKKAGVDNTYQFHVNTVLTNGDKVDLHIDITPSMFEAAVKPIYRKCKKEVDKVLASKPNTARIMLLVGGSTKNPFLQEMLKRDYSEFDINDGIGQDLAVTMGAAIKGKIDKFGDSNVEVFDILPLTIGANCGGIFTPIIEKGTTLPASNTIAFTTVEDDQVEMQLELLQGESRMVDDCVSLGILKFKNIPKMPAGEPTLCCTVTVSANSVMKCIGSVDGNKQEMTLDLTGEKRLHAIEGREEKLIKRWKRTAAKMDEENGTILNTLIEAYPLYSSKKDIMQFIREHSEGIKDDSK